MTTIVVGITLMFFTRVLYFLPKPGLSLPSSFVSTLDVGVGWLEPMNPWPSTIRGTFGTELHSVRFYW